MSRTSRTNFLFSTARALAAVAVVALASSAADAALLHRWSFNAGNANDSVGTSHGSLVNGATVTAGQLVLTNGVNAPYVEIPANGPNGVNINTFPNVTVQAWYTRPAGTSPNGFRTLVAFGRKVTAPGGEMHGSVLVGEGNGADYLFIQPWRDTTPGNRGGITDSNFTGEVGVSGAEIADDLEHVLTISVTNTTTGADVKYYIDSLLVGTASGTVRMSDLSNNLAYIGRALYNDPALPGSVNEVRMYNNVLTDAQVAASVAAGPNSVPVPEPAAAALGLLGLAGVMGLRRRA